MRAPLSIVHDYLTQRGGAERVVAAWTEAMADAPIYTSLFDPDETFEIFSSRDVRASWLNSVPALRHRHRAALPFLAPTMGHLHVDADTVLASSSGWAHGVRTPGRLIVYCHAPARWLYQSDRYLRDGSLGRRAHLASVALRPYLTRWDRRAATRADTYLANSRFTASLIEEIYDRPAEVLAPPVRTPLRIPDVESTIDVLIVARLLPYKNVDLALDVAAISPELRFRIVGDGPLRDELRARAPGNVSFAGVLDDDDLWREYRAARVHLALSHEDFGITPLEAAMCGRPTVARRSGGYLDTITAETGVLIDEAHIDAATIRDALDDALRRGWDEGTLRQHADLFSADAHLARLRQIISPR